MSERSRTELLRPLRASTAACLAARRVQRAWLAPCRSRQACGHERLGAVSTDLATAHTRFDQEGRPYLSLLPHASGPCRHPCCLFSHSFQHRSRSGRSTLKSSHKSRRLNSLVTKPPAQWTMKAPIPALFHLPPLTPPCGLHLRQTPNL